jgi:Ferric reductase NAD binding domain
VVWLTTARILSILCPPSYSHSVGQYEHVVLISGGVGATPFASITKYVHNWILTYTERGANAKDLNRNQTTRVAPVPAPAANTTPPPSSGLLLDLQHDPDQPPPSGGPASLIRNVSNRFSRNMSAVLPRNQSEQAVEWPQPLSQSMSLNRNPSAIGASGRITRNASSIAPHSRFDRNASALGMQQSTRPGFAHDEHSFQGQMARNGSGAVYPPRGLSAGTLRSGPLSGADISLSLPSDSLNSGTLGNFLTDSINSGRNDYDDDLGDPDAPVPDRRQPLHVTSPPNASSPVFLMTDDGDDGLGDPDFPASMHQPLYQSSRALSPGASGDLGMYESGSARRQWDGGSFAGGNRNVAPGMSDAGVPAAGESIQECNSTTSLFSHMDEDGGDTFDEFDAEEVASSGPVSMPSHQQRYYRNGDVRFKEHVVDMSGLDDEEFDEDDDEDDPDVPNPDSLEFENMLMREAPLESNAANLMGLSYGSTAMMRHMMGHDRDRKMRPSLMRASMTMMEEALDNAVWQERALFYLHSVTVNWFLLWTMLARYCLAALATITNGFQIRQKGLAVFNDGSLILVDLGLALVLAIPVIFAVVLELRVHGLIEFLSDSYGNMFDITLLMPLSISCVVLTILGLLDIGSDVQHVSKVTLFLFWPTMSLLLLWRIGRTIGSRVTLAQYFKSTHSQTKSLDFIWVSKTHAEDEWLVREMLPLAGTNIVRLHRYVTREGPMVEPWTLDYEKIPLKTQHQRPDWDEVFAGIAERSRSGSVIGVFHCGPSTMAMAVQQGAMRAMAKSLEKAYRCGYMQSITDDAAERPRGDGGNNGTSHGCAVRFSLREEMFG